MLGLTIGLIIALLPAMFSRLPGRAHHERRRLWRAVANALLGLGGGIVGNILLNVLGINVGDGWIERIMQWAWSARLCWCGWGASRVLR